MRPNVSCFLVASHRPVGVGGINVKVRQDGKNILAEVR